MPVLAIWTIYLGLRATGCCNTNTTAKGDSPLFAGDNDTRGEPSEGKKGTVPAAVYRARHRRLAHWTYPIWLYVSVTGVVVYLMLYHLWPPPGL